MAEPFNLFGTPMTGMNPNAQPQGAFGSAMTGMGGARPSGRSWMDPNRYNERMLRFSERQARNPGASRSSGGGSAAAAASQDLPEGVAQTNATTGQIVTVLPPTETGKGLGAYNRKVYERLGVRFEPEVGIYDPRTGLSRKISASEATRQGLLGSAQRALLEGLNRGQTFSRTNPFV
jgi:hypothetical protein